MTLAPHSRFGPYTVTCLLGVGLSSEVYRCRDTARGREVALKIHQPESGREEETRVAQFYEEALILRSIRHPNIIEVYDSGIENGTNYIVSEFLDGRPLGGPLPAPELTSIAAQIAAGVTVLHDAGIVHNDLKPKNLIQTTDGRIKIIDFGMARKFTPEMLADPQELALWHKLARLDQLAFGLSLYELASGHAPFEHPKTAHALSELLGNQLLPLPPETQFSMQAAIRRCAAEDGSHASLLLTAMSVALSLAGAPLPRPET
jgi:serine/threonine protein kinase